MTEKQGRDSLGILVILVLGGLNVMVWCQLIFAGPNQEPEIYFLDVGQGDSTLTIFPGNVKVLTDAGYGFKVVSALDGVMSDKYIDLAIITHPQLDHFGGFSYLLDRYQFGAFIVTGREAEISEWDDLVAKIDSKKIPIVRLAGGDDISQGDNVINFLSPSATILQSAELNDTSLVSLINFKKFKLLLTGDAGFSVENFIINNIQDFSAEVIKVGHHGSKYSTSEDFVKMVDPVVAVIEVGQNQFGHPSEEALERLSETKIFRTDINGTVRVTLDGTKLQVYTAN